MADPTDAECEIDGGCALQQAAIAKVAPKLAHDVRKPFSMMIMALDMLDGLRDPAMLPKVVKTLRSGIEKELHNVDALLRDLSELGSRDPVVVSACSVHDVVAGALSETARRQAWAPRAAGRSALHYDMRHDLHIRVEFRKAVHATDNLMAVVFDGMNGLESLKFETVDVRRDGCSFVDLRITGRCAKGRLFSASPSPDAFFRDESPTWEAARLAVARKIVLEHGGSLDMGPSNAEERTMAVSWPAIGHSVDATASKLPCSLEEAAGLRPAT